MLKYLNSDLVICSPNDLTPLVNYLEQQGICTLWSERAEDGLWWATMESPNQHDAPESTIAEILTMIEAIPTDFKPLWNGCTTREFDMGFDSGHEPRSMVHTLSMGLLQRVVTNGCTLKYTLYAV